MYSVYLDVGIGLKKQNLDILYALREHQARHWLPWVIGGDWKMDPDELASVTGFRAPGVQVHVPEEPTCHSSSGTHTISDYFVT